MISSNRCTLLATALLVGCVPEPFEPVDPSESAQTASQTTPTAQTPTAETPTATQTPLTPTAAITPTASPTPIITPTATGTPITTPTVTPDPGTLTPTGTPILTPSPTPEPTSTPSGTGTPGQTPTAAPTGSPTDTAGTPGIEPTPSEFTPTADNPTGSDTPDTTPTLTPNLGTPTATDTAPTPTEDLGTPEPTPSDADGDGIGVAQDCDDSDPDIGLPTAIFYADGDGDGYGDGAQPSAPQCTASESHPAANADDCDDGNAEIYPSAPEITPGIDHNCDGMMRIPAGDFIMGADTTDAYANDSQGPEARIDMAAFDMDIYEITVADYRQCVIDGQCDAPESESTQCISLDEANNSLPINCINQKNAQAFCEYVDKSLPSEAQWQMAARGSCAINGTECDTNSTGTDGEGDERIYPWGNDTASCTYANGSYELAETCSAVVGTPLAHVGSFSAGVSPYGIHDMAGNVAEWVVDCYHSSLDDMPSDGSPWVSNCESGPADVDDALDTVVKGGSYFGGASDFTIAARPGVPSDASPEIGFRCAKSYDGDNDGFGYDEDCDDSDASISPDATESCNGLDDDCDGDVDELACGTTVAVDAGQYHSCFLEDTGEMYCWGLNDKGQSEAPTQHFSDLASGASHTCGTSRELGTFCWGDDSKDQLKTTYTTGLTELSSLLDHSCALLDEKSAHCWGSNTYGQIDALPTWELLAISAGGSHSCAITSDQSLICWGRDDGNRSSPPENGVYTALSAGGHHSCAIDEGGALACWGYNSEPGSEVETGQINPPSGIYTHIAAGGYHSCALNSDGAATCWGSNSAGQSDAPEGEFVDISAGWLHTCAVQKNGTTLCWGDNTYGQIGSD